MCTLIQAGAAYQRDSQPSPEYINLCDWTHPGLICACSVLRISEQATRAIALTLPRLSGRGGSLVFFIYLYDLTSVSITEELKGNDDESCLTSLSLARFRLLLDTQLQLYGSKGQGSCYKNATGVVAPGESLFLFCKARRM